MSRKSIIITENIHNYCKRYKDYCNIEALTLTTVFNMHEKFESVINAV